MPFLPRRIHAQLILLVSCILFATGAISAWITAQRQSETLLTTMRSNSAVMTRSFSENAAHYLVLRDYAGLESFLLKSAELPDVTRLQVCEPDGAVVGDIERPAGSKPRLMPGINRIIPPPQAASLITIEKGALIIWQPIQAGSMLGWIKATFSMASISEVQEETWKNSLMLSLLWVVCSGFMLLLVLRPTVLAVGRLSSFARSLDERKGDQMEVGHQAIEIEELGASLNYASTRLFTTEHDLIREREALKEQYSTLRGIIESADALIFSVDRHYRYTSFNAGHAAVMQAIYGREIRTGERLLDFMTVPEDREKAQRNLDRALAGERFVVLAYSGEDALSRLYFEVSHNPILAEDNSVIGVAVLSRDMTERRNAELRLRASEQAFRAVVENTPDVIVRYDREGRRMYVNPEFERVNHLSSQEVIGKKPTELSTELAPMADVFTEKLMAAMGSSTVASVDLNWTKEGKQIYWFVRIVPEFDETGNVVSALTIWSDITDRKRAEGELRRLNEELEQRVKDRTAELQEKNQELERMNKLFVGRELRMVQLKEKIAVLESKPDVL